MQFFKSVAVAVSAFAAFAAAQSTSVAIYNMPDTVMVGKPTTLQTKSSNGPFTLTLRRGNPNDLQNVSTITTTGTGSSFTWTPSSDLESGSDYAIMISQGEQSNYTPEFTITGGKAKGTSSSSSVSAPASYAASTMSTAAKSAGTVVSQISDGQPQAPTAAPAVTSVSSPKVTPVPGFNSAAVQPAPYVPMPGATGSPVSSNTTMPTYSVPSPTSASSNSGSSSSSSSGAKGSSAPAAGAAAQFGSSLALVAGAAAAFVFLN